MFKLNSIEVGFHQKDKNTSYQVNRWELFIDELPFPSGSYTSLFYHKSFFIRNLSLIHVLSDNFNEMFSAIHKICNRTSIERTQGIFLVLESSLP